MVLVRKRFEDSGEDVLGGVLNSGWQIKNAKIRAVMQSKFRECEINRKGEARLMVKKAKVTAWFILAMVMFLHLVGQQTCRAQSLDESNSYRIGANDILSVYVWKEPELTRDVTVMPDGRITFPLAGEIMAQGQTPNQLKQTITEKLRKYVTAPEVTVIVRESRSRTIYAIGKVMRPGPYPLSPGMTVLQALSAAGGFAEWADTKHVLIIRRNGGKEEHLSFNYTELISGRNPGQNILLKPGDTVVVP